MVTSVILISDDDLRVSRALARQLMRLRLPIRIELDDQCALALRAAEVRPSLIVLDILQPTHGLTQLLSLRAQPLLRDIPVVAVSAVDDDETRRQCQRLGVLEFVLKPFPEDFPERLAGLAICGGRASHELTH